MKEEDQRVDPIIKLTRWMTDGIQNFKKLVGVQDRTRTFSPETVDYFSTYDFFGSEYGLDNPMYKFLSHEDQMLMISYEGRGREEAVSMAVGLEDSQLVDQSGAIIVRHKRQKLRKVRNFEKEEPPT